jgi:transcriptional regulator with XRE-family HTH domain
MRRGRPKPTPNEERLRNRLAEKLEVAIGKHRGAISAAAKKTGIKKQSLSLYMRGKATPTPETLRILCSALPLELDVEGIVISAGDFPTRKSRSTTHEQLSLSLTDAILSIPKEHLRVEVLKRRSQSIDLKVSIDFASHPKGPKQAKGRTLAVAS